MRFIAFIKRMLRIKSHDDETPVTSNDIVDALIDEIVRRKVQGAYDVLVAAYHKSRITKAEMAEAMSTAIGYLGEVLDD